MNRRELEDLFVEESLEMVREVLREWKVVPWPSSAFFAKVEQIYRELAESMPEDIALECCTKTEAELCRIFREQCYGGIRASLVDLCPRQGRPVVTSRARGSA